MNVNKRFQKEIRQLYIQQSQRDLHTNDYLIYYDETDVNKLHAIIRGPTDSVYRHKFIRLDLMIPDNYPHSPPEVIFINYDGVRIHPNMYENGKCCATILNTWGNDKFEKWTSSMGIETILLTFHSFLDNNPYTYEPGGGDDPSYTVYVQHQSWTSCLIRYLQNEQIELFTEFMHNYLLLNIDSIFSDLHELSEIYPSGYYQTRCFEIETFVINYQKISSILEYYYNYIEFRESHDISSFDDFINMDYDCCICYDTFSTFTDDVDRRQGTFTDDVDRRQGTFTDDVDRRQGTFTDDVDRRQGTFTETDKMITLQCNHRFHKVCLQNHIRSNNNICPMCRRELIETDTIEEIQNENVQEEEQDSIWMINPLTRRRIKIGGRTYNYLKSNGDI
jgi:ubiquitin-protein ligase